MQEPKRILEDIKVFNPQAKILWGLDKAVLGICGHGVRGTNSVLLYSQKKCIETLVSQGMTEEKAFEYFESKILTAIEEHSPLFLFDFNLEDIEEKE